VPKAPKSGNRRKLLTTSGTINILSKLPSFMTTLRSSSVRHRIDPLDIPAVKAARRLHLTLEQFRDKLPELIERGFPPPDPTTGNFFLPAIDNWMASRTGFTTCTGSHDDVDIINNRIARL